MICPMCGKELILVSKTLICPTKYTDAIGRESGHYALFDNQAAYYIFPYRILSFFGKGNTVSAISKWVEHEYPSKVVTPGFYTTLLILPEIHPDTEDNLRQRVKKLLLLS